MGIRADIGAVICLKRPDRRVGESELPRVLFTGLRADAVRLEVEQSQAQGERVGGLRAIIEEQQSAAYGPAGIHENVVERHLVGVPQYGRRAHSS